jgi:hypothetical protein
MVRLAQQQLSSSTACANGWMPLTHLLIMVQELLCCWRQTFERVPAFLQVVVRMLLPLVQRLQGCGSLLVRPAAAVAGSASVSSVQAGSSSSNSSNSSSSSNSRHSCEHQLQLELFRTQHAVSRLLRSINTGE